MKNKHSRLIKNVKENVFIGNSLDDIILIQYIFSIGKLKGDIDLGCIRRNLSKANLYEIKSNDLNYQHRKKGYIQLDKSAEFIIYKYGCLDIDLHYVYGSGMDYVIELVKQIRPRHSMKHYNNPIIKYKGEIL